jgi:hypothetical protein
MACVFKISRRVVVKSRKRDQSLELKECAQVFATCKNGELHAANTSTHSLSAPTIGLFIVI